jgi:hypothetical protein
MKITEWVDVDLLSCNVVLASAPKMEVVCIPDVRMALQADWLSIVDFFTAVKTSDLICDYKEEIHNLYSFM